MSDPDVIKYENLNAAVLSNWIVKIVMLPISGVVTCSI